MHLIDVLLSNFLSFSWPIYILNSYLFIPLKKKKNPTCLFHKKEILLAYQLLILLGYLVY